MACKQLTYAQRCQIFALRRASAPETSFTRTSSGPDPRQVASRKFMFGLPMNPATNRLTGLWNSSSGEPICSITPPDPLHRLAGRHRQRTGGMQRIHPAGHQPTRGFGGHTVSGHDLDPARRPRRSGHQPRPRPWPRSQPAKREARTELHAVRPPRTGRSPDPLRCRHRSPVASAADGRLVLPAKVLPVKSQARSTTERPGPVGRMLNMNSGFRHEFLLSQYFCSEILFDKNT